MEMTKRLMGWFMLMLITGGCATSHPVSMPGAVVETDAGRQPFVHVDDKVRVVLDDGTKIKGKVLAVSRDSLTLEFEEERTWRTVSRVFQVDRIESIEKRDANTGRTVGLIFGILLAGLIVAVATAGDLSVNSGFQ